MIILILIRAMLLLALMGCVFVAAWLWCDHKHDERHRKEIAEANTWHTRYLQTFEELEDETSRRMEYGVMLTDARYENEVLQDHLSSILRPRNDHIWIGGRCKRCGRRQLTGEVVPRYAKYDALSAEVNA